MELTVTVRDRQEAALAAACGVRQIDVRDVQADRSATPKVGAIRDVVQAVPDASVTVLISEDLQSPVAAALSVLGAASTGATHLVLTLRGCANASAAVARLSAAVESAHERGVLISAQLCVDREHVEEQPSFDDLVWIAAEAGCAGVVVETAVKDGTAFTSRRDFTQIAGLAADCHAVGLTCRVGGEVDVAAVARLRTTGIDSVVLRTAITTGRNRVSRLDPWMVCRAIERAAGVPLLR